MFGLSHSRRIYICARPTDMRKSFDGLCGEVINFMRHRPTNGALYVFFNKRRNRMKVLVWDRHGFWILYKRLEQGRFQAPHRQSIPCITMNHDELLLIIEGIDLSSVKRRKRYCLPRSDDVY